ncbi:hypothetical protein Rleg_7067 (plasmid) [Rhizobium leguminosarum bv. trifolii WSM1325]|uniref:Uncharacterized protein n=1 Tax=Rhizobium leguminosarum bv. trifolii (strain WSM1325) TaxID=395491 RepID=C6B7L9_RHILS|nr:hypothetical protein Rleg_7067 [Rhizobium leguminosarum bv. trifolii WSM1325]
MGACKCVNAALKLDWLNVLAEPEYEPLGLCHNFLDVALFSNAFQRSLGLTLLLDAPESATISANLTYNEKRIGWGTWIPSLIEERHAISPAPE